MFEEDVRPFRIFQNKNFRNDHPGRNFDVFDGRPGHNVRRTAPLRQPWLRSRRQSSSFRYPAFPRPASSERVACQGAMRHDHHQLILSNARLIVQSEVGSGLLGCRSLVADSGHATCGTTAAVSFASTLLHRRRTPTGEEALSEGSATRNRPTAPPAGLPPFWRKAERSPVSA